MDWIGKGIIAMQAGDSLSAPHGAFLSWRNVWHAYGNSQATSLLMTGKTIENGNFISNGLVEVKYFYPYLIKNNYLNQFHAENKDDKFYITNITQFSQIAYGIRPMVWASLQAFQVSRDSVYAKQAGEIASWLLGQNISGRPMYDPHTGRCFDGIEDNEKINKNSGAESTIEALLILIEVENNPISKEVVFNYYNEK
jgi:hypothetical protein